MSTPGPQLCAPGLPQKVANRSLKLYTVERGPTPSGAQIKRTFASGRAKRGTALAAPPGTFVAAQVRCSTAFFYEHERGVSFTQGFRTAVTLSYTAMGMFDEIRCDVPLPDGSPTDVIFHTKSFPEPSLQRYIVTAAGRLVDREGQDLEPEGYVTFYPSSSDGDDSAHSNGHGWKEYRARFSEGQLVDIVCVEKEDPTRSYGLASFRWFNTPSIG